MKRSGRNIAFCIFLTLSVVAAAAVLVADASESSGTQSRQAEFQTLVLGLGLGASSHVGECECRFDCRISDNCQPSGVPMMEGMLLSSHRGCQALHETIASAAGAGDGGGHLTVRRFLEIARTGYAAILLHPMRSTVTICAMLALLVPWITGLSILKGIERDAAISLSEGGDLYVTGEQFGRTVPLSLDLVADLQGLDGVESVVPRIVGRTTLGQDRVEVVAVGLPLAELPKKVSVVDGRLPAANELNEFLIGTELAKQLNLEVGSLIPPFYRNDEGERVSRIVGTFHNDAGVWQSHMMLSSFETAETIFGQTGLATDIVIRCRSGYAAGVAETIRKMEFAAGTGSENRISVRVVSRTALDVRLAGGQMHQEGIFNLHFVLMFVVGILVVLVTSGIGLTERRREVGILKATGWQTDEILFRSFVEGALLSLLSASLGIVLAFVWLRWFNGFGVASIFLSGVETAPSFRVPFRLTPVPAILAITMAFTVIMTGTLWSSWRSAIASPAEAMR